MTVKSKTCLRCGTEFHREWRESSNWRRMKYCSRDCVFLAQTERSLQGSPTDVFDRFVDRSNPEGCWNWLGTKESDGYGRFHHGGIRYRAHVYSLELDGRPVGVGQIACHHCDNPSCVRPDHLYPGTHSQNTQDAISRGRWRPAGSRKAASVMEATR